MISTAIPIPFNLEKNDRDRRGYPIPFVVYRDKDGQPHFTINDDAARSLVLSKRLCALCGKPLKMGQAWLIGGSSAAFHEQGLFIDPPSHEECGRYAMQVCPYLAAPNYSKRIDDKTLKPSNKHEDTLLIEDTDMNPARPEIFVFARTSVIKMIDAGNAQLYIQPRRPWKNVEFWQQGKQITEQEARAAIAGTEFPAETLKWWPR